MSLVLYGHLFSSYTQKVLIALYENDTPFEFRGIGPESPQHVAECIRTEAEVVDDVFRRLCDHGGGTYREGSRGSLSTVVVCAARRST